MQICLFLTVEEIAEQKRKGVERRENLACETVFDLKLSHVPNVMQGHGFP